MVVGALIPLHAALSHNDVTWMARKVEEFSRKALAAVLVLFIAGAAMLAVLSGWQMNLRNAYHQGFAIKLAMFAAILLVAAINKLRCTPRLVLAPEEDRRGLHNSIGTEVAVAAVILVATAVATSFSPLDHL